MTSLAEVELRLLQVGYRARPAEAIALRAIENAGGGEGMQTLLLSGPPGCGKTSLAAAWARVTSATFVQHMLHSWTDNYELFVGINVAAAVVGDGANVPLPGCLLVAAQASQEGRTVLLLDEVDKSSERTENLLLDFLQSGRVPTAPGEHQLARQGQLVVVLTTNDSRQLSDALLRRVRRVRLSPLPVDSLVAIVETQAGVPAGVARMSVRLMRQLAADEGNRDGVSVQEMTNFARDVFGSSTDITEVCHLLAQWGARTSSGQDMALRMGARMAPFWGEVVAARRAAQ